jgi:hypothetical protein
VGGFHKKKFADAGRAHAPPCHPGANAPLHLHPVFHDADIYREGKPTNLAHANRDLRVRIGDLPVTESMPKRCFSIPWFKHERPELIAQYAEAFKKVALSTKRN